MTETLALLGCGGHSRSVADVALSNDPSAALVFVDANAGIDEGLLGFRVVKDCPGEVGAVICALGDNARRKALFETLDISRLRSVISNRAYVSASARVGVGVFVAHQAHVGPLASIGDNCIINTGAIVEHEVQVAAHSHVGPNATVSGRCRIGEVVFVGVGATVKDYVNICSHVTIGAGATVVHDIVEPGTYVGTPARRIK